MTVKYIPDGYHTITPYLLVRESKKCLDFLKRAFDAKEVHCMKKPDGTIMHAELKIGDSMIMMADAGSEKEPMPAAYYLYVEDTDELYKRAIDAGGISLMEPADQFYGDRNAGVQDPAGNQWWIGTHVEDVPQEEIERRAQAFKGK